MGSAVGSPSCSSSSNSSETSNEPHKPQEPPKPPEPHHPPTTPETSVQSEPGGPDKPPKPPEPREVMRRRVPDREVMEIVRDVEFTRWDDDDEDETPLRWSLDVSDGSMRRRFLCDVIRVKDLDAIQGMITSGWDVNETYRQKRETFTSFGSVVLHDNFRALHQGARESWQEGVRVLLEAGADVDSFDFRDSREHGFSYTALMHAANNSDEPLMRLLVEKGANVNARDPVTHNSALLLAAVSCSIPCVSFLISQGAEVNVVGKNNQTIPSTPLLAAVYYYRLPQWHHLSHEWKNTEGRERSRMRALSLMRMLIDRGCDVNAYGSDLPPLHNSAGCRDHRALELLLASGANVNLVTSPEDRRGRTTALAEAAFANSLAGVNLLIQHGANLDTDWICRDTLGAPEQPLIVRLLNRKYYDIVASLIHAGWCVSSHEKTKMADICATITSVSGPPDDSDSDEEETNLYNELLNMSDRSKCKRLKLEDLRGALNFLSNPRPLRWICRKQIRLNMRSCSPDYINALPLPVPLLRYVLCQYM